MTPEEIITIAAQALADACSPQKSKEAREALGSIGVNIHGQDGAFRPMSEILQGITNALRTAEEEAASNLDRLAKITKCDHCACCVGISFNVGKCDRTGNAVFPHRYPPSWCPLPLAKSEPAKCERCAELEQRCARLEAALKPFAEMGKGYSRISPEAHYTLRVSHLLAAREALKQETN